MKTCRVCKHKFFQLRSTQPVCSIECAIILVERKKKKSAAEERRATREALEKIKTHPTLSKEVEQAMNAYVRLRDFADGCISCSKAFVPGTLGGACDAGHYRSKGSAAHLRFDVRNVQGQCKHCNSPRGKAGNHVGYRLGLVAKIGLEAVEALEADNDPRKYTRENLRAMRDIYRTIRSIALAKERK